MTPKEKAKELISSMYQPIFDTDFGIFTSNDSSKYQVAKQCALIAVDEIIDAIIIIEDYDFETLIIFWQKVKQEIENHDTRTI